MQRKFGEESIWVYEILRCVRPALGPDNYALTADLVPEASTDPKVRVHFIESRRASV